ncbi:MAG: tetratricopeptide repeat protein [Candidatus Omnitrophica bacterium]|nr:tetratricopeptide repeat protein [Candidatus Omnitrophota bacterium]
MKNILNFGLSFCILIFGFWIYCHAAEVNLVDLSKKIMDSKCDSSIYPALDESASAYFKDHKFNEYFDFISSLVKQKNDTCPALDYNAALARYNQLKYLEETQGWDEYFAQGNTYRDQIVENLKKAIDGTTPNDQINIKSHMLLWQFHRDQQDAFDQETLTGLINAVTEYAKGNGNPAVIKEAADKIASYGEKGRSKEIYRMYVDKLTAADIKLDELKQIAVNFYKEGNLDLAESIFDSYIEKAVKSLPKEKVVPELTEIASMFSYKAEGQKDMVYAEKIFAQAEGFGGKEALNEEQIYLRALNLEKSKDWAKCADVYANLISRFPDSKYADRAAFKVAVISTYILRDRNKGADYFVKLAEKNASAQSISSLYQLGLLSQWDKDYPKAKAYYNKLLEKAQNNFSETQTMVKARLKEIEGGLALESNLLAFLDDSLKKENSQFDMSRASLTLNPYSAAANSEIAVDSSALSGASGCMQVELQYLWSGDLGSATPQSAQSGFPTTYKDPGSKVIFLVVLAPSGTLDRALDFADID